jgi:glycosyltransferase involved in cell wall biosynthesis
VSKVSIIIPVYNSGKYMKECICSVLNQSYENLGIIIINDGSTDKSFEIAQSFQDNKIKLLSQENKGAASARNLGLHYASGELIQFLDSDDILDKDKIKEQIILYDSEKNKDDTLYIGAWNIIKDGKIVLPESNQTSVWHDYNNPMEILLDFIFNKCCMPPLSYMIPISLVHQAGLWNETLSMNDDGEYLARIISQSKRIKFCSQSLSFYRSTPNSLSKRISTKAATSQIKSLIMTSEVLKGYHSPRTQEGIYQMITSNIYRLYPYYKIQRKEGEKYLKKTLGDVPIKYPSLNYKEWLYYIFKTLIRP